MSTVLLTAVPLLAAGGFVYNAIRHLFRHPDTEQPVDVVDARINAAIAATDHPGRCAALTIARQQHPEGL